MFKRNRKIEKIVSFCCAIWLVLVAMVSGAMAYDSMTEEEFAAGGDHYIEVQLLRQQTDESGAYVDMNNSPVLYPQASGYTENVIRVKNNGNIDTFHRVLIAIPTELDGALELVKGNDWQLTKTLTEQDCEGERCNIYIYTMNGSLTAGSVSEPAILGVRMDAAVQQQGSSYVINGKSYDFGDGLQMKVYAQAVQTAFLQFPEYAFATAAMSENPWAEAAASTVPVSEDAVKAVMNTLPNGTDITGHVTDVVLDTKDGHSDIMQSCYGQPVDKADPNGPWAYYQATTDAEDNTVWTVYILADDLDQLPEASNALSGNKK